MKGFILGCVRQIDAHVNRKINMIAGSIMPLILLTSPPTDMDDYFHLTIEILALISIVTTSFKWKEETKAELS